MGPRLSPGATKWSKCTKRYMVSLRDSTLFFLNLSSFLKVNVAFPRFVRRMPEKFSTEEETF